MKGITLFLSPLLALASDQTIKLRKTTRHHLDFVSLHLDDMEPTSIKEIADDLTSWKEPNGGSDCAISVVQFRENILTDHIQVAQLFTSINICFNHFFEVILSNPDIHNNTPLELERCNHCPGCHNTLQHLYTCVGRNAAQEILFAAYTSNAKYTVKALSNYFSEQDNLDQRLFQRN